MHLFNTDHPRSIVLITSQAFSLINFRGSLISALVKKNISVYALAPDYDDELRQQIVDLGAHPVDFSLVRTGMNPLSDVLDMLKLAALLRRLRPDVTLGYFIKPVIYGTLAAWIARVPRRVAMIEGLGYVFTPSGITLSWRRKVLRRAVSLLYRVALARAHRVIFLNKDDIAEFVDGGLVDQVKVAHLGGIGVDLADWRHMPAVTKPVTFLLVARLLREKGIAEYAGAAKLVKTLHPETRFVLLGGLDPNPGGLSQTEVQAWVTEGLLEWPGHVMVKPWLAQASVFVLPSYREGLPRSTQEAMAMGRPVITTDVPGCRETVEQGVNGFMVPVRDAGALAQALLIFVKQPELIAPMGASSRRMAEAKFDVHKINAEILKIMAI
jgi:glycosyltransferase involved in cell wall biosynthesis